jgi:hypothetical protein
MASSSLPVHTPLAPVSLHWLLAGMFLMLFGTKAALIATYGSSMPYWDQWDGEAANLYIPYLNGTLDWALLFDSHNEHRIFVGRLLALFLLELAGVWDPLLQMLVNAGLHTLFLLSLVWVLAKILPPREHLGLVFFTMLLFMLPIGWENTIAGFQSQFYFLLIFAMASILALSQAKAFSVLWFLGLLTATAGYFSMASGALTLFSVAAIIILQLIVGRRAGVKEILGVAVVIAVSVVMMFNVKHIGGHDQLKAQSIQQFLWGFLLLAGLPLFSIIGVAIVHAPLFSFAFRAIKKRKTINSVHWPIIALGGWVALQMASLAYGRAIGVASSRYLDLVIIAWPINYAALRYFAGTSAGWQIWRKKSTQISVVWFGLLAVGLAVAISINPFLGMFERAKLGVIQTYYVENFLASGNLADLENKPFGHIPYPSAERLGSLLADPTLRAILPAPIRPADADIQELNKRLILGGKLAAPTAFVRAATLKLCGLFIALGIAVFFALYLGLSSKQTVSENQFAGD